MVTPDQLRQWARGKLTEFIDAAMRGESIFPLEHTRFGRADRSAATVDLDLQVRRLLTEAAEVVSPDLAALARPRRSQGYSVSLALHRLRGRGGEQPLPNRVWFETADDFLTFIGESSRWETLRADIAAISTAGTLFGDWARTHARDLRMRLKAEDGNALGAALAALHAKPQPRCFAREIPLPGISGKFIEENLALLTDILRAVGSDAWREGRSFHEQLGLRQTSRLLRLMDLKGDQLDYGIPISRFTSLPSGVDRMLIVENLRTFLTLPRLPGTLALFGEGHAVQTLSSHHWFAHVPIVYWGDLDPTGFDILGRLRRVQPHVRSIMMDTQTLNMHSSLLSNAAPVENPAYETLTIEEGIAAARVLAMKRGIEQEKLPTAFIQTTLQDQMH